jgi:hypothetical protein
MDDLSDGKRGDLRGERPPISNAAINLPDR